MALMNTSFMSLYLVLVAMEMDLIGLLHLFLAQTELTLLDVPKAVAWVGKSIVACIQKDLYLINVRSTVGFTPFIVVSLSLHPSSHSTLPPDGYWGYKGTLFHWHQQDKTLSPSIDTW